MQGQNKCLNFTTINNLIGYLNLQIIYMISNLLMNYLKKEII